MIMMKVITNDSDARHESRTASKPIEWREMRVNISRKEKKRETENGLFVGYYCVLCGACFGKWDKTASSSSVSCRSGVKNECLTEMFPLDIVHTRVHPNHPNNLCAHCIDRFCQCKDHFCIEIRSHRRELKEKCIEISVIFSAIARHLLWIHWVDVSLGNVDTRKWLWTLLLKVLR